jgi:TusA-related sulfurtransferase
MPKISAKAVKKRLDVRGKLSPFPEIEVREAMKVLGDWEVLEVIAEDALASEVTIPRYCERKGYAYEVLVEEKVQRIFIEKTSIGEANRRINVAGQFSPFPELRARDTLREMSAGETLAILTDDQVAVSKTLPHFCHKMGYRFDVKKVEPGLWQVRIEKS